MELKGKFIYFSPQDHKDHTSSAKVFLKSTSFHNNMYSIHFLKYSHISTDLKHFTFLKISKVCVNLVFLLTVG